MGVVHPYRFNSLFVLKALPEYKSLLLKAPKLTLINCKFEYFYNKYDTIITVDTADFRQFNFSQTSSYTVDYVYQTQTELYSFVAYLGGERGANITI